MKSVYLNETTGLSVQRFNTLESNEVVQVRGSSGTVWKLQVTGNGFCNKCPFNRDRFCAALYGDADRGVYYPLCEPRVSAGIYNRRMGFLDLDKELEAL